jgi:hypothetical protein
MVPLMSESMERSLGLWEWMQLKLHLLVCAWCTRYLQQIKFIRQLLREDMPTGMSSVLLNAEAHQRISTSLLQKHPPTE